MTTWAKLILTDGTVSVNLLDGMGFHLVDWQPSIAEAKGGGVWKDSPLGDGRRLAMRRWQNVIETFKLNVAGPTQAGVIHATQDLRNLLEQALNYWSGSGETPVWIEARSDCETNSRYALVYDYRTPADGNPYGTQFSHTSLVSFSEWELIVERGQWLADAPGVETCLELSGEVSGYNYWGTVLVNGGFETAGGGGADVFANWTETAGDGAIAAELGTVKELTQSAKLTAGPTRNTKIQQNVSVVGATTYLLTFWYSSGLNPPRYEVINVTAGGTSIIPLTTLPVPPIGITWMFYSTQVTIPAGCFTAGIIFRCPDVNANVAYFDYCVMRQQVATYKGRSATCTKEVFLANKSSKAQLTDAYYYNASAGTWGGFMPVALPSNMYPPGGWEVGDSLYFGVDLGMGDDAFGPFSSVVFDLNQALAGNLIGTWEYWNSGLGAWAALLNIIDLTIAPGSTYPLSASGVCSLSFIPPANWGVCQIAGVVGLQTPITGYFIRLNITGLSGLGGQQQQQNRRIYTVCNPAVSIDGDDVYGNIQALAAYHIHGIGEIPSPHIMQNFVLFTRSLARGTRFDPYINISDMQQPSEISVATAAAYATDTAAPTGSCVRWVMAAPGSASLIVTVQSPLADHYKGTFRALLRLNQSAGAAGDMNVSMEVRSVSAVSIPAVYTASTGWQMLDFGLVTLPSSPLPQSALLGSITFDMTLTATAALTASIYDLILIPVDEGVAQFNGGNVYSRLTADVNHTHYADVDSIAPKTSLLSMFVNSDTGWVDGLAVLQSIASGPLQLSPSEDQMLGVVFLYENFPYHIAMPQAYHGDRYLSMRGDR